ncbi:MAG: DNA cytosine methyltransferase [Nitrospinae bacterium]|nr:DNA cytosine methyltransferase [Nitrospinota bacterium]
MIHARLVRVANASYFRAYMALKPVVTFSPSLTQNYKQFGNSVAVNVLKAIIKEIYSTGCFENRERKNTHNKSLRMDTLSASLQACQ